MAGFKQAHKLVNTIVYDYMIIVNPIENTCTVFYYTLNNTVLVFLQFVVTTVE